MRPGWRCTAVSIRPDGSAFRILLDDAVDEASVGPLEPLGGRPSLTVGTRNELRVAATLGQIVRPHVDERNQGHPVGPPTAVTDLCSTARQSQRPRGAPRSARLAAAVRDSRVRRVFILRRALPLRVEAATKCNQNGSVIVLADVRRRRVDAAGHRARCLLQTQRLWIRRVEKAIGNRQGRSVGSGRRAGDWETCPPAPTPRTTRTGALSCADGVDHEFAPLSGARRWTWGRYTAKLRRMPDGSGDELSTASAVRRYFRVISNVR